MNTPITVLAPIKLAKNKTETDLLDASETFQKDFVDKQPGVLRRELVKISEFEYLDIIQFSSEKDALEIIEKEKESPACHKFFSVMDMSDSDKSEDIAFYQSLATYQTSIKSA